MLIVDDDEDCLVALPETLRLRLDPIMVKTTRSSEEALKLIEAEDYDVITSEIRMPKVSGLTLAKAVQARRPSTPMILITGDVDMALAVQALDTGAYDFMRKPIDPVELVLAVRGALEVNYLRRHIAEIEQRLVRQSAFLKNNTASKGLPRYRAGSTVASSRNLDHFERSREIIERLHQLAKILQQQIEGGMLVNQRVQKLLSQRVAADLERRRQKWLKTYSVYQTLLASFKPRHSSQETE
jgi:FixJ family two-component response regulator